MHTFAVPTSHLFAKKKCCNLDHQRSPNLDGQREHCI